ncbi:MAG: hypothetical protein HRT45_13020, partial [Bdellovibrionales bacterium]|nr:hypothetical protein [Bdellovibrionales bacterium]
PEDLQPREPKGPFDPSGISLSDFVHPFAILESFSWAATKDSAHPVIREMSAKLLSYLIRVMDTYGGIDESEKIRIAETLYDLRLNLPNNYEISQAALHIVQTTGWPDLAVSEAYAYLGGSAFVEADLNTDLHTHKKTSLQVAAVKELEQMTIRPERWGEGYEVADPRGDSLTGDTSWMGLIRMFHADYNSGQCPIELRR